MCFFGGARGFFSFRGHKDYIPYNWLQFYMLSKQQRLYENGMKTTKIDIYANRHTARCRFHGAKNKSVFQRQLKCEMAYASANCTGRSNFSSKMHFCPLLTDLCNIEEQKMGSCSGFLF